jgi:hypothetical protein
MTGARHESLRSASQANRGQRGGAVRGPVEQNENATNNGSAVVSTGNAGPSGNGNRRV